MAMFYFRKIKLMCRLIDGTMVFLLWHAMSSNCGIVILCLEAIAWTTEASADNWTTFVIILYNGLPVSCLPLFYWLDSLSGYDV